MGIIEISSSDWQDKILSAKNPVIVDFWATWCSWCMKLMPVFEEVSKQYEGKLVFAKVNVGEHEDIAKANGIMSIPVIKMFCDGRNVGEIVGYMSKENLVEELDRMLSTTDCIIQISNLQEEVITK
jgi:thioredoxin 1